MERMDKGTQGKGAYETQLLGPLAILPALLPSL